LVVQAFWAIHKRAAMAESMLKPSLLLRREISGRPRVQRLGPYTDSLGHDFYEIRHRVGIGNDCADAHGVRVLLESMSPECGGVFPDHELENMGSPGLATVTVSPTANGYEPSRYVDVMAERFSEHADDKDSQAFVTYRIIFQETRHCCPRPA